MGTVKLDIVEKCQRCSMVNVDPTNLKSDPSLLRMITTELKGCFGVYAKVKKVGKVTNTDKIYISENAKDSLYI
jgi:uncharacterized protein YcbX